MALPQIWHWILYLPKICLSIQLQVSSLVLLPCCQVMDAAKQLLPFSLGLWLFQWCWWDGQHCCSAGETPLWNSSKLRELIMKILTPWTGSDCSPSQLRKRTRGDGNPVGQLLFTDPTCSSLHVVIWAALQPVPEQNILEMASVSHLCWTAAGLGQLFKVWWSPSWVKLNPK